MSLVDLCLGTLHSSAPTVALPIPIELQEKITLSGEPIELIRLGVVTNNITLFRKACTVALGEEFFSVYRSIFPPHYTREGLQNRLFYTIAKEAVPHGASHLLPQVVTSLPHISDCTGVVVSPERLHLLWLTMQRPSHERQWIRLLGDTATVYSSAYEGNVKVLQEFLFHNHEYTGEIVTHIIRYWPMERVRAVMKLNIDHQVDDLFTYWHAAGERVGAEEAAGQEPSYIKVVLEELDIGFPALDNDYNLGYFSTAPDPKCPLSPPWLLAQALSYAMTRGLPVAVELLNQGVVPNSRTSMVLTPEQALYWLSQPTCREAASVMARNYAVESLSLSVMKQVLSLVK